MGSVKIDINKGKHEWKDVNFSTIESIRGIIKYRTKFDLTYNRCHESFMLSDTDLSGFSEDIMCLYIDLDSLISKCDFTDKQKQFLKLYMDGNLEEDIAEDFNISRQVVNRTIESICKKIQKENERLWLTDNMLWNYKEIDDNYKQCNKCGDWLLKDEYFYKEVKGRDGYKPKCMKCTK